MKILFSDMDGTVIDKQDLLHTRDRDMMHKVREEGHKVAFNTGRNYQEALFCVERHAFPYDYLILNNGAHIVDNQGIEIFKKVIPGAIGKAIIEHCIEIPDLWVFFYNGDKTLGYMNGKTYEHTADGIVPNHQYDFMEEYQKVENFDIFALNQDNQEIDILLEVQAYIAENYAEYAAGCLNVEYLDVTPAGCTKGTGVLKVQELLAHQTESYCVGDSFNDVSMFEVADYAYTFYRVKEDIAKHTHKQVTYIYEVMEEMIAKDS